MQSEKRKQGQHENRRPIMKKSVDGNALWSPFKRRQQHQWHQKKATQHHPTYTRISMHTRNGSHFTDRDILYTYSEGHTHTKGRKSESAGIAQVNCVYN